MLPTHLSLLIFDKSEINLELIEDFLEKEDVTAEITLVKSTREMIADLGKTTFSYIVIFQSGSGTPIDEVRSLLPTRNSQTPIYIIVEQYDRQVALKLTDSIADNVYCLDELDYFIRDINRHSSVIKQLFLISEQRKTIQKDHARFQTLVNNIPIAVAYCHQGAFVNVNPVFSKFFNLESIEKVSETSFLDIVESQDHERVKHSLNTIEKDGDKKSDVLTDVMLINNKNEPQKVELQFHKSNMNGEDCIQVIINPELQTPAIPEVKIETQNSQSLSPEYFVQKLNQSIKQISNGNESALCMIEAADYYRIKKNLGITRAERVMHQVHDIMMTFKSDSVLISQLGTDVYCLLITKQNKHECVDEIEKIQETFNEYMFSMEESSILMPLNSGLVHLSPGITSPDQAFSLADVACTVSRNRKQHKLHVYNPEQDRSTVEAQDQNWTFRIKDAIENDNFKLVFQPIISLKTPGAANYEVLLRMKSSSDADILPSQFLHAAKQSDLEIDIDQWVITNAVKTLNSTNQTDTTIFVKLCESSLRSINFINWLEKFSLYDRRHMVLEIGEDMAIKWPSETLNLLKERQHSGYRVCIEQFGNHPDSQTELFELNADFYKIDGAFINHLATNRKSQSIIHKISLSTSGRNIKTIACFVQDADSLAILWQEGIDYIQGNYLQAPQSDLNYQFESVI